MVFGKSKGFASGKASREWQARSAVHSTSTRAANESAGHLEVADELSHGRELDRGETSTEAPLVPKKAKEAGRPAVSKSLEQTQRSKWNTEYYKRKIAFFAPPPLELAEADAAYSKTKTGKLRKDTPAARVHAKSRVVAMIGNDLAKIGDGAQQAQGLKDFAESAGGKLIAKAAGYLPDEAVVTAVYHQGQV